MSDAAVNVTIGAKIDTLISEFKKAASSVQQSAQSMASTVGTSMNQVEMSSNEATAALQRTEREADQAGRGITGAFGNVGNFLSGVLGPVLAGFSLQAAVSSVMAFADAAESLGNTAQIINTTATALSRLHATAEPMGISADMVDGGMKKLAKSMTEAARGSEEAGLAFAAVGIKAADIKNMSIEQVLMKISDRFKETEDGATKAALSMALMGRSGSDLIPWLNQGSEAMDQAADAAEAMGAVMGEDAVAAGAALDDAMDTLGMAASGLKKEFAKGLAPALQFVAESFTDGGGTAVDFGGVFKGVATLVVAATSTIRASWTVISSIVRGVATAIFAITDAMGAAARFDFAGAKAALTTGKEMFMETFGDMEKNLQAQQVKTRTAIAGIWGAAKEKPDNATLDVGTGKLNFAEKGGGGGGADKADNSAKKAAEAAEKKAAQDAFEYKMELLKGEMDELQRGSEAKLAIVQQMSSMIKEKHGEESREYARAKRDEVRIAEEIETEKVRIKDAALVAGRERGMQEIAIEKGKADFLVATGQMTAVQRAQVDRNAEEQLYAMQMSFLQQRLALFAAEPAERERINIEIERLQGDHQLRMQGIDQQNFEANKAQWDTYFQSISGGFEQAIQGMIFQGTTLREAMGNILQSILGQLIKTGVGMVTNWITTQLGMTTATVTGAAIRTGAEVASAKTSSMATAGAAIKNIMTKAVEVFANVYSAIAGIPYVGPFLAPVMAVAAGATIVGLVGKVASAEGGWDRVPYDGARAILHKEEMVLPAPLAEGIRGMVDGGGSKAGNVTIMAWDRRDVQRHFDDNSDVFMRSLAQGMQNNPGGM